MGFQNIDSFDRVAEATFTIWHAHCIGCINHHVGKKISISDS